MTDTNIFTRINADLIEPQRLAGCVVDQVLIERRRRDYTGRALSARDALKALKFEATFVSVAAQNLAQGIVLTADDLARLMIAWALIDTITSEAGA